jgi:hypothetical protein
MAQGHTLRRFDPRHAFLVVWHRAYSSAKQEMRTDPPSDTHGLALGTHGD